MVNWLPLFSSTPYSGVCLCCSGTLVGPFFNVSTGKHRALITRTMASLGKRQSQICKEFLQLHLLSLLQATPQLSHQMNFQTPQGRLVPLKSLACWNPPPPCIDVLFWNAIAGLAGSSFCFSDPHRSFPELLSDTSTQKACGFCQLISRGPQNCVLAGTL